MSNHWSAEENGNYRGPKLSGWIIRYDPTPDGKVNADGSTSYSLNFPALVLTDIVGEPEKQASKIAIALESHEDLVAALKACVDRMGDDHPGSNSYWDAVRLGEAALAKAGEA